MNFDRFLGVVTPLDPSLALRALTCRFTKSDHY